MSYNYHHIDFGTEKMGDQWVVLNDGVMGGLSKGKIAMQTNSLQFKGEISLANNGGFASIRSPYGDCALAEKSSVVLSYRTVGYSFAFLLKTDKRYYNPYYKLALPHTAGYWKTARLDLMDFEEYIMGRKTGKKITKEKLKEVIRLGIITNEKKADDFFIEINYLKVE